MKQDSTGLEQNGASPQLAEPPVGLVCRDCGCRHFFVVYTTPARNGIIRRRRECRNCARRITTREQIG